MHSYRRLSILAALCILLLLGCTKQPLPPETTVPTEPPERSSVRALWAEELSRQPISYTEYIADSYDPQARIILLSSGSVSELKLLKLEFIDITEDGKISYHTDEVFSPDIFSESRPLILGLTFFGDIPNYGISYIDNYGDLHSFALQISGENGNLLLLPM